MKSKTKISKQEKKKTNPNLVETINVAKKHQSWLEVASLLSMPRRKQISINLDKVNKKSLTGDTLVVPGKVLSIGEVDKKIRIVAMSFSESAKEKLLTNKCEVASMLDEIKKNPEAKGVKILK